MLATSAVAHLLDTAPYYYFFIDHKGTKQTDDLPKGKGQKDFAMELFDNKRKKTREDSKEKTPRREMTPTRERKVYIIA